MSKINAIQLKITLYLLFTLKIISYDYLFSYFILIRRNQITKLELYLFVYFNNIRNNN